MPIYGLPFPKKQNKEANVTVDLQSSDDKQQIRYSFGGNCILYLHTINPDIILSGFYFAYKAAISLLNSFLRPTFLTCRK